MTDAYEQEDAQEILKIAFTRQTERGEITRTQLIEIAEELGISPQELELAEQEWLIRQDESRERQAFNAYRQGKFQQGLTRYAIVNTFLVSLDLVTGSALNWSLYIVFGWGLLVALNAWKTYQRSGDDYERSFQRWRLRRQVGRSLKTLSSRWLKGITDAG